MEPNIPRAAYRETLVKYYTQWNPQKVKDVDTLLDMWKGKEAAYWAELGRKYGVPPETPGVLGGNLPTDEKPGPFCVVCGRSDRQMVGRKSGLKCRECVGKSSNTEYRNLQHQQAQQLLAQHAAPGVTIDLATPLSPNLQSPTNAISSNPSFPSQRRQSDVPLAPQATLLGQPLPFVTAKTSRQVAPPEYVEVALEEVNIFVINPEMQESIKDNSYTIVNTVVNVSKSETAAMYHICMVNKNTGAVLQMVRVRFSQCDPVFRILKEIGKNTIPDAPGKHQVQAYFNGMSSAFIEERRIEMERFLQGVMSDHFLSRHPALLDLLRIKEVLPSSPNSLSILLPNETPTQSMLAQWKAGPLLGKGAFGAVYMGLLPNSSFVAVKVISLKENEVPDSEVAELRLLETLQHPNVVQYFGTIHNKTNNQLEIFTEFVEGGSVASVVKRFGALEHSVIRKYTKQVLEALVYLHNIGIVHRDIKGDNLLVAKHGEVKLADFGCSKNIVATEGNVSLAGTPMWMAPEVIRGEAASVQADIWSVGCVLIEMLGKSPWKSKQDENAYSIMFRIQAAKGPPDNMPSMEEIGDTLHSFLMACFTRESLLRPTAKDLLRHPFLLTSPSKSINQPGTPMDPFKSDTSSCFSSPQQSHLFLPKSPRYSSINL